MTGGGSPTTIGVGMDPANNRLAMMGSARSRGASFENAAAVAILTAIAILPLVEFLGRITLGRGIPGSAPLVQNLTLWLAFLGAALAARSDSLLALSTPDLLPENGRRIVRIMTHGIGAGICAGLFLASLPYLRTSIASPAQIAMGIPRWVALLALPTGFLLISLRLVRNASDNLVGRLLAAGGVLIPVGVGWLIEPDTQLMLPGAGVVALATILGMPVFTGLAGAALVLFWTDAFPVTSVVTEATRLTDSPYLPAIPLFTFGGYILARGGAGRRLMQTLSALVGWLPGGLAIVVTLILAFFTPLTGASGVTILAMGGLLLPIMTKAGYTEETSVGLVTVSGSIGLLLPPSLPVILYAVYGTGQNRVVPIDQLFIGALVPGFLLILAVAAWASFRGWAAGSGTTSFRWREAVAATWTSRWEILLPVALLGGYFGGFFASLVEAAAFTVAYAVLVECVIHRDMPIRTGLGVSAVECATLVGSFLVILAAALAFNNYLLTAGVPQAAVDWVEQHISSPVIFLLAVNLLLIVVGALMDVYSAIFVIAPLVAPMGVAYGINPVHLGVIFLANMELGYLMPPMGENLFLSAMRFDKSLSTIYKSTLPFVAILTGVVLLITYVPGLTLWLVDYLAN